ncbi:hypothetical protein BXZ70DRAFT_902237 [Cristinia sonorae]|uniref:Uncharacterized protein n=1 Tax=Cristinia sonorae TaxID=1940300 RepID=A0A8K0UE90_9AGAR|nr:hypothetical protein BXZ70DRAFT_902237 [Cristinia sonorae]
MKAKKYIEAIAKYKEVLTEFTPLHPNGVTLPLLNPSSEKQPGWRYNDLNYWQRMFVIDCCNNIALCYLRLKDDVEALRWFLESDVLFVTCSSMDKKPIFDWTGINPNVGEWYIQRITALSNMCDIFLRLGNTSQAVSCKWASHTLSVSAPPMVDSRPLRAMVDQDKMRSLTKLKHPDAALSPKLKIQNADMQVMGSWQKIVVPKSKNILPRMGFCKFVWKSRLYIFGGEKSLDGPHFRDLQYIDLENTDGGWKTLPRYMVFEPLTGKATGWKMRVHEGQKRAYLFNGRTDIEYFDLETEKWGSIETAWTPVANIPSWPYHQLLDFSMEILDDKIYVFGGSHSKSQLGCNLFVVLDLQTLKWRYLSGSVGSKEHPLMPDWTCPGPRRHPTTWVDPKLRKIFLMFGEADRVAAQLNNEPHGAMTCYGFGDFWSWDVKEEKWTMLRMEGNPPCARSEVAYNYNRKLGKTVIFGGYSPTIPCVSPEVDEHFSYSYYADTYVYTSSPDPQSSGTWKQVLTRGFPTYRAQAALVSDPATGKIFLFGGYTNAQFVRDKKHVIARSFGDLWWLRLDVAGTDAEGDDPGYFRGVDLDEDARTAKVGPWQRCFNCGSAGPWKKCGGTCGGKAFFCDASCLKEGWREHKNRHKCQNKK